MIRALLLALALVTAAAPSIAAAAEPLPDAPKPIKRSGPKYPREAEGRELVGRVRLVVTVGPQGGRPTTVQIDREAPEGVGFGEAAVDAVGTWEYAAGTPGTYGVTVTFALETYGVAPPPNPPLPSAPTPVSMALPVYPAAARAFGIEGTPEVAIRIADDGSVDSISVIRRSYAASDPASLFGDAAARAVMRWRFAEGSEGTYSVSIAFTLARLANGELARDELDR